MPDPSTAAPRSSYREKNSTAERALDILSMFGSQRLRITAAEVAGELGVARSTAYRYLLSLSSAGYLEEDPASGFRLGLKVFELARLARVSYGLSRIAVPVLRDLAATTQETALLTRRSGRQVICLEREEPAESGLRMSYERGSVLALNAGASAWVLLAWEPAAEVERLVAEAALPRFTDATLTGPAEIAERLARIRQDGYAVSRGELDPDAVGIAAPVWNEHDRVIAGVSLVAIGRRVTPTREPEVVARVRAAADRISQSVTLTSQ